MNIADRTASQRIGRIARAIATAGVGLGLALGSAATSSAERVWDIREYDSCMRTMPPIESSDDYVEQNKWCCYKSGGDWIEGRGCGAPPAQTDNVPGGPVATGQPRPPAPGGTEGVSDDPQADTPLPTPNPRPRPPSPPIIGVG